MLLIIVNSLALLPYCLMLISLYRLFLHPLSSVPGPKSAALSNAWLAWHARNGRVRELGKTLHRKYRPVVRVGPNEVWFDSKEAFKFIYNASNGFEKSDFYLATALNRPQIDWKLKVQPDPDTLDFLSERDMKRYRLQRRMIGPAYHPSNLEKYGSAIDAVLRNAVAQLRILDGAEVDLKQWMHIITVECLGAAVLSWSPGYIRAETDGGTSSHAYLSWRHKSVFGMFPLAVIAGTYSRTLGRLFARVWGIRYRTPKGFKTFFTPVYQKASRRINSSLRPNPPKDARKDLLSDLIQLHKEKPAFKEAYLRRLAITNFGAGHETTTSALTATIAMISSHPASKNRVLEEVDHVPAPTSFDTTSSLSYTQACIKEAQRLHPVIGMALPRRVPAGGAYIHGHYFPAGTTVGCNPISLHQNGDIFGADADVYNPGRWFDETLDTRAMKRYNLTWGGGARTCPGRHLAELILHKVVPTLMREFDIQVDIPPEEDMPFYFMAMLSGVKARFLPRNVPEIAVTY
ncbi:cytochrome P450 [Coniochaeta sp. 2T2.1]|nr:cytochrome P450 [Coniochaeta sp. 2T2.1]